MSNFIIALKTKSQRSERKHLGIVILRFIFAPYKYMYINLFQRLHTKIKNRSICENSQYYLLPIKC